LRVQGVTTKKCQFHQSGQAKNLARKQHDTFTIQESDFGSSKEAVVTTCQVSDVFISLDLAAAK
jgi:hypothetical protein